MISGGDELSRTQHGNNNAYCQDNEISWYHWNLDPRQQDFLEFVRYVVRLRREHPVFRRRRFFQGRLIRGADVKDIAWFEPSGKEMDDDAWNNPAARCLGMRLSGTGLDEIDEYGAPVVDDPLFVMISAYHEPIAFTLPGHPEGFRWERLLDTGEVHWGRRYCLRDSRYKLRPRSLTVLRLVGVARSGRVQGTSPV